MKKSIKMEYSRREWFRWWSGKVFLRREHLHWKWIYQFRVCALSCFTHVCLFETPWTVAHQAPPSMGFSRQEYWSGVPCPPPGDLPHPGMEPVSLMSPALAGGFFTTSATWDVLLLHVQFSSVQFSRSVVSYSLQPHESQHAMRTTQTINTQSKKQ